MSNSTDDERRRCLEKVLTIDPENTYAKQGLQRLKTRFAQTSKVQQQAKVVPHRQHRRNNKRRAKVAQRKFPEWRSLGVLPVALLVISLLACGCLVVLLVIYAIPTQLIATPVTSIPTPAIAPTSTSTPISRLSPIQLLPLDSKSTAFPFAIFVQGSSGRASQGWVDRYLDLVFVNHSGQALPPSSLHIYRGYLETQEGKTYDIVFRVPLLGHYDRGHSVDVPVELFIPYRDSGTQPVPSYLPFRRVILELKYAEAAHPTRAVVETSQGDWSFEYQEEDYPSYTISEDLLKPKPLDELITVEIRGSNQVKATINPDCAFEFPFSQKRLGLRVTLENSNQLDEESVSLQILPTTFWGYYGLSFDEARPEETRTTIGPGQTQTILIDVDLSLSSSYSRTPDYVVVLNADGSYRVAKFPKQCFR